MDRAAERRREHRRPRPAESPGVLWALASGNFVRVQVDHDDWQRFRHLGLYLSGPGYAAASVDGRSQYLHRLIFRLQPGEHWPDGSRKVIDHLNRDKLDCRKSNMVVCTQKENCANRGGYFAK